MADPSIILDIEPDWGVEPEVSYAFTTVVQDTPYFVEQRRPLLVSPVRSTNYKFTESNEQFQRLCNTLVEAKDQQICVPIFSEPIFAASIVTGGSSITATTSLTYSWNINHCSYVVLLNFVTGESEMIGVTSVSGQLIRLATNIVGVWIAAQTVIFPAIAAELVSMKQSFATDSTGSIEAEFSESALGAEATGEWVDLEEQTCCEGGAATDPCSEYYNGTNGSLASELVFTNTIAYGTTPTIQNNKLQLKNESYPGDYINQQYSAVFEFLGDFDVYLSFEISFLRGDEYGHLGLKCWGTGSDATISVIWTDGTSNYYLGYGASASEDTDGSVFDLTGKLRMRRVGSNLYVYYWNDSLSQWEWKGDTNGLLVDDLAPNPTSPYFEFYAGDDTTVLIGEFVTVSGCDNTQPVTP